MLDDLVELLYRFPGACRAFGAALYAFAGFALVCGAYTQLGMFVASVAAGVASQTPITQVAQLLPGVWTWWIPESFPSVVIYVVLVSTGAALALTAKKVERQMRGL